MPKKTVAVECPQCKAPFTVQIDSTCKGAETSLTAKDVPPGHQAPFTCPHCKGNLFVCVIR